VPDQPPGPEQEVPQKKAPEQVPDQPPGPEQASE
jgi:hypothetical protein